MAEREEPPLEQVGARSVEECSEGARPAPREGNTPASDVRALIDAALAGERASTRRLFVLIRPLIQTEVAKVLDARSSSSTRRARRQELEDIVQATYEDLWANDGRALRTWDSARGRSFESFIRLLAHHMVISLLVTKNRWRLMPVDEQALIQRLDAEPDAVSGPEVLYADRELLEKILDRLPAELSPTGLGMFRMLFVEELTPREIAERTKLSPNAVDQWRARLRKLARIIAAELLSERSR